MPFAPRTSAPGAQMQTTMSDALPYQLQTTTSVDVVILVLKIASTGISATLLGIVLLFALFQRRQYNHHSRVAWAFLAANLCATLYVGADAAVRIDALMGTFQSTLIKIQLALTATVLAAATYLALYWIMAARAELPRTRLLGLAAVVLAAAAVIWIPHPHLIIASDSLTRTGMSVFADYGTLTPLYFGFLLALTSLVLITLLRSPQRHVDRAGWQLNLAGLLLLLSAGAHDALRELGHHLLPFSTLSFGMVGFQIGAFGFVALQYARILRERRLQAQRLQQMHQQLERDPATGLYSRRHLQDLLEAGKLPEQGGLLFIDLDNFKRINDHYGHLVGDRVLTAVAQALFRQLRDHDLPCRWGGDEFLVYLPDSSPEAVITLSERLRRHLTALKVDEAPDLEVRISMGYARLETDGWRPSLARADQALYASKRAGRDRLTVYSPATAARAG